MESCQVFMYKTTYFIRRYGDLLTLSLALNLHPSKDSLQLRFCNGFLHELKDGILIFRSVCVL
jgi:hypothetical protein